MPGKPNDKLEYLKGLNEKDFPYLIADILTVHYKHENVKVVDGTGDGKRDIFSIDMHGNPVITQCKYHYDFTKTSGTSETDEIIIALHKFNYHHGFFCTSGKLSPQSKREYLDSYKNFEINWLEGHEIVDIVLESLVLRKIWFENERIHLTTNKIAIPFILRLLPENKNFSYPFEKTFTTKRNINLELHNRELINPKQFYPLSQIDIRNSKNYLSNISGYMASIGGNICYNSISEAKQELINRIACDDKIQLKHSYIAMRFGVPYIPENKESYPYNNKEKLSLPISSQTYIISKGKVMNENDFLRQVPSTWKLPDRIHMSQLNDFCFYNQDVDVVLYIEYTCNANAELHPHVERQLEVKNTMVKISFYIR